ncbi:MAG: hypothetical protein HFJ65_02800 [Eggerthellaceae bacterium]|nr:hypothetical protein [Eggerthellaceae bacterium]
MLERIANYSSRDPQLMIFTSMPLTRKRQTELISTCKECGFTHVAIFDKVKISELIEDPKNADILRKNYKLWISHTEVLTQLFNRKLFVDCDVFLMDAQSQERLFVQTTLYDKAREHLEEGGVVLIVGDPGTGKTTITKMLALSSAAENYTVLYSASGSASEIKDALSSSEDAKELVVLDDFLGQSYLDVNDRELDNVMSLINYVRHSKNRRLILNSRFTILNDAKARKPDFVRMINTMDEQVCIVNSEEMTDLDRARILLANLIYGNVPEENISNICLENHYIWDKGVRVKVPGYYRIITHKNYNPRIIEYACLRSRYESISSNQYYAYIIGLLENPADVWENEFNRRLSRSDRWCMYLLFSLSEHEVSDKTLHESFERLIYGNATFDLTKNDYRGAIQRLTNSLLRKTRVDHEDCYSVLNPSINDYILGFLADADSQSANLVENAAFADQINRIAKVNKSKLVADAVSNRMRQKDILLLRSIRHSTARNILEAFVNANLCDNDLSDVVIASLKLLSKGSSDDHAQIDKLIQTIQERDLLVHMPKLCALFTTGDDFIALIQSLGLEALASCLEMVSSLPLPDNKKGELKHCIYPLLRKQLKASIIEHADQVVMLYYDDFAQDSAIYDEEEGYLQDSIDMPLFCSKCATAIMEDYSDWRDTIPQTLSELEDESASFLSDKELERLYANECVQFVEEGDFYWAFEEPCFNNKSKNKATEQSERDQIDRLFREYV